MKVKGVFTPQVAPQVTPQDKKIYSGNNTGNVCPQIYYVVHKK